ncbi:alpha/beta hydrolase [Paenibacillus sp. HB172176]|uniref:alpha/beta fold hydrolase n=1 Tax=Paenibacillus sp. HB172176 TaxID=2493690 RepID=UPI00143A2577|nr:alpha/beta hydrolase [Paenibacillus sp. HB172176]
MNLAISKDGTKLAYDRLGSGPALILVAGAFSYRHFPAQLELAERLAKHFTVFNYDRRGRGDSGNTMPYATEREIEDLDAIINEAGGSAYVWGLSSGAALALQAAAKGLAIIKLALHEPPFIVQAGDFKPPEDFVNRVNELGETDQRAKLIRYFMIHGMGAPAFVPILLRMMPKVWSNLIAVAHTLPYDAALLDGFMAGKPLAKKDWTAVKMPTLVLEGRESPAGLRHATGHLAEILPNASLLSRKGLGHTKRLNAEAISQALIPFFHAN